MYSGSVAHQNARQSKKFLTLIRQFILILEQFNQSKNYQTYNPYRKLASSINLPFSEERKSSYYLNLFDSLVHQLTLFNQIYRVEKKNKVLESSKEDIILALELLAPICFKGCFLSSKTLQFYQLLEDDFSKEVFTIKQLTTKLKKSKSTLKRHLRLLEEANYIQRTGGNKRTGYQYKLVK